MIRGGKRETAPPPPSDPYSPTSSVITFTIAVKLLPYTFRLLVRELGEDGALVSV